MVNSQENMNPLSVKYNNQSWSGAFSVCWLPILWIHYLKWSYYKVSYSNQTDRQTDKRQKLTDIYNLNFGKLDNRNQLSRNMQECIQRHYFESTCSHCKWFTVSFSNSCLTSVTATLSKKRYIKIYDTYQLLSGPVKLNFDILVSNCRFCCE